MTSKWAYEIAKEQLREGGGKGKRGGYAVDELDIRCAQIADRAYEAGKIKGRIAGLREAARWVAIERHDRSDGTNIMLRDLAKGIRAYAHALAKKVRTPK